MRKLRPKRWTLLALLAVAALVAGLAAAGFGGSQARPGHRAGPGGASLAAAARTVRHDQTVLQRGREALQGDVLLAATRLHAARLAEQRVLREAPGHANAPRVCDDAVIVNQDAVGVTADSAGLTDDLDTLGQYLAPLRADAASLAAALRDAAVGGTRTAGTVNSARRTLAAARRDLHSATAEANHALDSVNHAVAEAYAYSAAASRAGGCDSAAPPPAPLRLPAALRDLSA